MKKNEVEIKLNFALNTGEVRKKGGVWVLTTEKIMGQTAARRLSDELEFVFTDVLTNLKENETKAGNSLPYYEELTRKFATHLFELGKNSVDGYLDKDHKETPSSVEITYNFFTIGEGDNESFGMEHADNGIGFPQNYLQAIQSEEKGKGSQKEKFEPGERLGGAGKGMKLFVNEVKGLEGFLNRSNRTETAGGGAVVEFHVPKSSITLEADEAEVTESDEADIPDLSTLLIAPPTTSNLPRMSNSSVIMLSGPKPQTTQAPAAPVVNKPLSIISTSTSSS